jgi:hypothetical protein
VPKHQWLWSAHDEAAGHQRRYATRTLLDVVTRAGFDVDYHSSFFTALVAPMALRRIMPARARGGSGAAVTDPTSGHGLAARAVGAAFSHERRGLRRRARHIGTSIILVARARASRSSAGR